MAEPQPSKLMVRVRFPSPARCGLSCSRPRHLADAGRGATPRNPPKVSAHTSASPTAAPAGPAAPIAAALDQVQPAPVTVTVREASLIIINRDHRMYEWQTYAGC
jgi:hypothetical protein